MQRQAAVRQERLRNIRVVASEEVTAPAVDRRRAQSASQRALGLLLAAGFSALVWTAIIWAAMSIFGS